MTTGTCIHFADASHHDSCAAGVHYLALAGGGVFSMLMRLPCIPLSNRRGEMASVCAKFSERVGEYGVPA